METATLKTYEVTIPEQYSSTLKQFIKALSGKMKVQQNSTELDEALEDIRKGRVHRYDSFEEFKQRISEI